MTLYRDPAIRGYTLTQSGRPLKAYVYRGNGTDQLEHEYLRVPLEVPDYLRHGVCGTATGYNKHRGMNQPICDKCRAWKSDSNRAEHQRRKAKP